MKTRIIFSLFALLFWSAATLKAQQEPEQLNLPGDNLNLYAVMKIFQESQTLEAFEQKLNAEDSRINNLDLNGDNNIDYIKVLDHVEKNVHYITLQVSVTPTENQDVAVFVVKKDRDGQTMIQLIGDEALYGKYYIVEPYYDTNKGNTPNPGYYGNSNAPQTVVVQHTTTYEVSSWPLVAFIFLPTYVAWHSPYYWGYYPTYWHPWSPWYWHQYYGYHYYYHHDYYSHFHHGNHFRYEKFHEQYYGHRRSISTTVNNRMARGEFKKSYSKPETLRDGSEMFRKNHPDKVTKDMKEPDLKEIRTVKTDKPERQPNSKMVKDQRTRDNNSVENHTPIKTDRRNDYIKPEKSTPKQEKPNVKPESSNPKQEKVKSVNTTPRINNDRQVKETKAKKEEVKPTRQPPVIEKSSKPKMEAPKEKSKSNRSEKNDKPDRSERK